MIRADHVGSLLRPASLRQAHRQHAAGKLDDRALTKAVDQSIAQAVQLQEKIGLHVITDGEFRRASWFLGFVEATDGLSLRQVEIPFHAEDGEKATWFGPVVTGRVKRSRPIVVEDYKFLAKLAGGRAKVTLPTPSAVHFFGGADGIDRSIYPDVDEFFEDLAKVYREELSALAAAGCRYVQLDEVPLALLCDPTIREQLKQRGMDPQRLVSLYVSAINAALADRPSTLRVGMHLCRGNYKGRWMGSGGYDPIAEQLFNQTKVDAFLLEFDTERAGTFAPLRHLPAGKQAILGIISTKTNQLESIDDLRRKLDEAFKVAPADRLGVCPQCGFASSAGGNPIAPETQEAKLALVVDVARKTWGTA
jgi:5-methyltetrahydropteroyltriglutamate--homocysteine methyltransferase